MSHFVLIFDRLRSTPPVVEQFEDAEEAKTRLFEAERELRGDTTRGVVMLYGEDQASLRRTHGSYFLGLDELLETAGS